MIRAVVLDVDGVIVGDKEGFNFPHPHKEVIEALAKIAQKGIVVSICTGKPAFAIEKIARDANLSNLHIADGGALGLDPIEGRIYFQYNLSQARSLPLTHFYLQQNIYMEFYTSSEYFVLRRQVNEFTKLHSNVLQREPVLIDDADELLKENDIIKVFLMAKDEEQKNFITSSFAEKFGEDLSLGWTSNPNMKHWKLGLVTAKNVSKRKGVEDISKYLNVPLTNILGIGDTMHDWPFIEICGYGATVENASQKLKELVLQKKNGYVGKNVAENGAIDVFKHFRLL